MASALVKPSTSDVVQSVSQTKGAIGYIGSYFLDKSVKAINLSFDTGRTYVQPSVENMKSKAYLLTRSLYCYYVIDRPNSSLNDRFCNFILGTFGIKYAYSAQLK